MMLSRVPLTLQNTALRTVGKFFDIKLCDVVKRQSKHKSELGSIPQHVSEFFFEQLSFCFLYIAVFISHYMFNFVHHLAGLARKTHAEVHKFVVYPGQVVKSSSARQFLILV